MLRLLNLTILSSLFFLSSYKISYAEMSSLGVLEGDSVSMAFGVSGDGSVIVGVSSSFATYRAFKYDSTNGMTSLGVLTDASVSWATDVSSDGSVIVGYSNGGSVIEGEVGSFRGNRAFKYDSTNGMTSLGVLTDASVSWATDVSSDGSVIVGYSNGG